MHAKIAKPVKMKQNYDFVFVLLWKDILFIDANEQCRFL
jgi:hypothetical protein